MSPSDYSQDFPFISRNFKKTKKQLNCLVFRFELTKGQIKLRFPLEAEKFGG